MIATNAGIDIRKTNASRIHEVDWANLGFGKTFSDHMAVIEYREGAWQRPTIVPYGPLPFSPAISALHYGQAIFEGLKAYKNEQNEVFVFRPEMNAERLNVSAARMCMPTLPTETFVDAVRTLVQLDHEWIPKGEGESLYLRPHMFAIDEFVGVRPSETYMFVIFSCPVGKYYTNELRVKVEQNYTRAVRGGTGHAKAAGNYGASLYPTQVAKDAGFDQILWTDSQEHAYFEESGTMNVVFQSGQRIMTPMLSDSILNGVTRDSVLQLGRDMGYTVEERQVSVHEIVDLMREGKLDAAFGVGTAATIAPIRSITYGEEEFTLKAQTAEDFPEKASTHLDLLKRGMLADPHHWNLRII